ncbi:hypothetical protein RhiirA1_454645 [Rhizophagus irregularis]|uniref:F-box domain-containing protein n=1 Tax=Rhizophagus irregularis TaxID=588596 RepID=A0A2N0S4M9_9GLOM|nr:hypothetical protein RhiirA1_454645 [Rhizophagus irregularis]
MFTRISAGGNNDHLAFTRRSIMTLQSGLKKRIFQGDLPELTYEIIKYFQNDISTLHSCILVNRLWCRLAIPLLWENPFSFRTGNCNFIEIYLHNLNNDLKSRLNEYKINDNSLPLNTLFNYPRLLKYLNTFNIDSCVEIWLEL